MTQIIKFGLLKRTIDGQEVNTISIVEDRETVRIKFQSQTVKIVKTRGVTTNKERWGLPKRGNLHHRITRDTPPSPPFPGIPDRVGGRKERTVRSGRTRDHSVIVIDIVDTVPHQTSKRSRQRRFMSICSVLL